MNTYYIIDKNVIDILTKNGFTCQKSQSKSNATIQFHLQSEEEYQKSKWYETNCPIEHNNIYNLKDGNVLRSDGTLLVLVERV